MNLIAILQAIATGLRDTLSPRLTALLQENAALRHRVAELEDADVRESAAAQGVKDAYDDVVGVLDHTDDVATPDPLPVPAEPADTPAVDDLPSEPVDVPAVPNPADLDDTASGSDSASTETQ